MKPTAVVVTLAVSAFFFLSIAGASEESPARLESLSFKGMTSKGEVTVTASSSGDFGGLSGLDVVAFGKHHVLSAAQLGRFDRMHVNGVQLTESGGSTKRGSLVSIQLTSGYVTGVVDKRFVLVYEDGSIEILNSIERWE